MDLARPSEEFDLSQGAKTLYWKAVTVLLRHASRDERLALLSIRILLGCTKADCSSAMMRMYLSSEADASFLHTLDVSEAAFPQLKQEQSILVDFPRCSSTDLSLKPGQCLQKSACYMQLSREGDRPAGALPGRAGRAAPLVCKALLACLSKKSLSKSVCYNLQLSVRVDHR